MDLKLEIKKAVEDYVFNVKSIDITTLKVGIVAVFVNGRRFGNYDINKHCFCSLMA